MLPWEHAPSLLEQIPFVGKSIANVTEPLLKPVLHFVENGWKDFSGLFPKETHGFFEGVTKFFSHNPFHGSNQAVANALSLGNKGIAEGVTKTLDVLSPAGLVLAGKGVGETVEVLANPNSVLRPLYHERWSPVADALKGQPTPTVAVVSL